MKALPQDIVDSNGELNKEEADRRHFERRKEHALSIRGHSQPKFMDRRNSTGGESDAMKSMQSKRASARATSRLSDCGTPVTPLSNNNDIMGEVGLDETASFKGPIIP